MDRITRNMWRAAMTAAGVLLVSASVLAQAPERVTGKWEGLSKGSNGDLPITVELTWSNGKFSGLVVAPTVAVSILDGKLEGDRLSLTLDAQGMSGVMTGTVADSTIQATWQVASESGSVELRRQGAAVDAISGDWAGEAMVQGQPMPVSFALKLEGELVTGAAVSAAGRVSLTSGSWKDGTLTIGFPYSGGEPVIMTAKAVDGKLSGTFDYNAGEYQGTWWIARK